MKKGFLSSSEPLLPPCLMSDFLSPPSATRTGRPFKPKSKSNRFRPLTSADLATSTSEPISATPTPSPYNFPIPPELMAMIAPHVVQPPSTMPEPILASVAGQPLRSGRHCVGCIDNIYKSVENLDTKYLNTKACKTMLLEPRSSAEKLCEDLLIKVDNLEPRRLYRCPNFVCFTEKTKAFSSVAGVSCSCGETMNTTFEWTKIKKGKQEVFLKGESTYMISDDLNVFPATVSNAVTLFQKLGIDSVDILEKQAVDVNRDELLNILKMLLLSKTPLTDVFLKKPFPDAEKETKLTKFYQIKLEDCTEIQDKATILKLVRDRNTKRVLYAEADHVMVDTFFSFLTFPLGSVIKIFTKLQFLGCVDNLYNSVGILTSNSICFASNACKNMLSSPCLYWHYECSKQTLKIESEVHYRNCRVHCCKICWGKSAEKCEHNISKVLVNEINPKMPNLVTENGGGYAKELAKFMITDEMIITPLTLTSVIDVVKDFKVSIHNLIFEEVAIREAEVMNLLRACLTSSGVLNSVFSLVIKKPRNLY